MKRVYSVLFALVVIWAITWNYVGNLMGFHDGLNIGEISDKYHNLFTPAGYAFSIWSAIYLGLLAHAYYQIKKVFIDKRYDDFVLEMGPWPILAVFGTGLWISLWLNELIGLSLICMIAILVSLLMTWFKLNMERWDAPFKVIRWIWWPFAFFTGWIAVALIANVAAFLVSIEWQGPFDEVTWTIIMISIATLVNLLMLVTRSSREFVTVGIWSITAIAVRHWNTIESIQ